MYTHIHAYINLIKIYVYIYNASVFVLQRESDFSCVFKCYNS